jgi:hypothetical protein
MSNLSIFKSDIPVASRGEGLSDLAKSLVTRTGATNRRLIARKGSFRRLVNGEEIGKIKKDAINVVIVNVLPRVSRQYYEEAYDPNGTPTVPDCWSNLGDKPDAKASNPQASNCASCPQNIAGSGGGTSRACSYQRRIAVVLADPEEDVEMVDPNGDVYQMNLSSTTLFGKGENRTHPFESYLTFLGANNESIDRIVTEISFDEKSETNSLLFTPVRHLTPEEEHIVTDAGKSPAAINAVTFTVAAQDGVKKLPPAAKEEFAPTTPAESVIEEPVKRASSKPTPPPVEKKNLADVVSAWSDED